MVQSGVFLGDADEDQVIGERYGGIHDVHLLLLAPESQLRSGPTILYKATALCLLEENRRRKQLLHDDEHDSGRNASLAGGGLDLLGAHDRLPIRAALPPRRIQGRHASLRVDHQGRRSPATTCTY